ncbi:hypothetical protein Z043_125963, partial [Scleropages formosus]
GGFTSTVSCSSVAVQMERKVLSLILLLAPGALLVPPEGQTAYNELGESYKKGVDLALQQVNSHSKIQHHFFFFKSLIKSELEAGFGESYIYHNFYVKATTCARKVVDPDPDKCPFRNDRPLIDCAVCYKTVAGVIEKDPKPYIHCIHKPSLTK